MFLKKRYVLNLVLCPILLFIPSVEADTVLTDERVRMIVKELMQQKDNKIDALEQKILQLETKIQQQADRLNTLPIWSKKTLKSAETNHYYSVKKDDTLYSIGVQYKIDYKILAQWNKISAPYSVEIGQKIALFSPEMLVVSNNNNQGVPKLIVDSKIEVATKVEAKPMSVSIDPEIYNNESFINTIVDKIKAVDESAKENGLEMSGFFDFSLQATSNPSNVFTLGAVELDLEYAYKENFAVSSAFVWDGGTAEIGVAVVDFHLYDHSIPARGRIFSGQGFHFQAGRFDLPFSTDYQYFAAPDRISVTAPMTTERIQKGGFGGDGARLYGSWNQLNYALFFTNSAYEDKGSSIGGRLGIALGQNTFRLHDSDELGILELGFSHLTDLDADYNVRSTVYGGDLSFNYNIFSIQSEFTWLTQHEDAKEINEYAYHVTLVTDLQSLVKFPLKSYIRYGQWSPDYASIIDEDESFAVEKISRLSFGFNYTVNDYLQLKFEYSNSLGSETEEPDFNKHLGTAQLVVAF